MSRPERSSWSWKGPLIRLAKSKGPLLRIRTRTRTRTCQRFWSGLMFFGRSCCRRRHWGYWQATALSLQPALSKHTSRITQMTNGPLIQFMNYVVVMVTLIKKQAPLSHPNIVFVELRCTMGAAHRAAWVSAGQSESKILVLPVTQWFIMSAMQQSHALRRTDRQWPTDKQWRVKL